MIRQDKDQTRQDKTGRDETRQDKTRQNKTRQKKTRQDKHQTTFCLETSNPLVYTRLQAEPSQVKPRTSQTSKANTVEKIKPQIRELVK